MKYVLAAVLFTIAYKFHRWYGHERGKIDSSYWRPIHANEWANLTVNLITLVLYGIGIYLLFVID